MSNPFNTVISYPIPAYQNVPIEPQFYKPRRFVISGITLGETTIVTTTLDMDYVIGQLVRLVIPPKYGSRFLNEKEGYVISIPTDNSVEIDLDSNPSDPFIPSPTFIAFESKTPPQILPVGDVNMGAINRHGRVRNKPFIPGSFRNISPF